MAEQNARLHNCGGHLHRRLVEVPTTLRGVTVTVSREEWVCDSCDETRVSLAAAEHAEAEAARLVREHLGLLAPTEIVALRTELGLTQAELEERLGLGAKTVVRWETGRVMQSKATDNLLRLVHRDPTAVGFLAGESGEPSAEPEKQYAEWPSWSCLPRTLRDRLSQRAEAEGAPLISTIIMLLSEQLTVYDVNQHMDRLSVSVGSLVDVTSVEARPWLQLHKDEYEQAS